MKKCGKCGAEFEGKFCPECGAKWQEKRVCPECGNELREGVRFCPECGCAVGGVQSASPSEASAPAPETAATTTAQQTQKNDNVLKTIRMAIKYIPFGLFALFSVLLFAFYAGSIAVIDGFGESLGSVYGDITDNIPGMGGSVGALIVFLLASLALSGFMAAALFTNKFKGKAVSIFGKAYMLLTEFLAYLAFALYFVFFVIAIVVMSKVSSFDGGMGMVVSGACPKLILAFAIIFSLLTGGALVADMLIVKKFPEMAAEEKAMRARAIEEKKAADERKRAEKEAAALRAAENNYEDKKEINVTDDTPVCFSGKPVLKKVNVYVRFRRMLKGMGIVSMILSLVLMCAFELVLDADIPKDIVFYVGLGSIGWLALLGIICVLPPASHWAPTQLQKQSAVKGGNDNVGAMFIMGFIFNIVVIAIIIIGSIIDDFPVSLAPVMALIIIFGLFNFMGIIACSVVKSMYKELSKHFYGTPKPYSDTRQVTPFVPEKEKALYAAYKKNKSLAGNYPNGTTAAKAHAVRSTVSVLAALGVIICLIAFNFVLSPFSANYVSYLDTSVQRYELAAYLGEPDEREENRWVWYGGEFKRINEKAQKISEEMQDAMMSGNAAKLESLAKELAALEKSAQNLTFESLVICFDSYYISSIMLDTQTRLGERLTEKVSEKVELVGGTTFLRGYSPASDLYVKCWYTDGSYKYDKLPASAFSGMDVTKAGYQTIEWADSWGAYKASILLQDSISGEYEGFKYTISRNEKSGGLSMRLSGTSEYGFYENSTPWDVYLPYVTEFYASASGRDEAYSFLKNCTSLRSLIISKSVSNFDFTYVLNDKYQVADIWAEATSKPSGWNYGGRYWNEVGLDYFIHYGNDWSYVNGVPTLKDGVVRPTSPAEWEAIIVGTWESDLVSEYGDYKTKYRIVFDANGECVLYKISISDDNGNVDERIINEGSWTITWGGALRVMRYDTTVENNKFVLSGGSYFNDYVEFVKVL